MVEGQRSEHERFEIDAANAGPRVPGAPRAGPGAGDDEPQTAFGTMFTDILDATLPGYSRPDFCEYIRGSRFASE